MSFNDSDNASQGNKNFQSTFTTNVFGRNVFSLMQLRDVENKNTWQRLFSPMKLTKSNNFDLVFHQF